MVGKLGLQSGLRLRVKYGDVGRADKTSLEEYRWGVGLGTPNLAKLLLA